MEENKKENKEDVGEFAGFLDFKSCLSTTEFETVFRICKERYGKLSEIIEAREKFQEQHDRQIKEAKESLERVPDDKKGEASEQLRVMSVLKNLLEKKAHKKMLEDIKEDIEESANLTEFLNKFSGDSTTYEELDFSFLSK